MTNAIEKYEKIVRRLRRIGVTAALAFGSLYVIDEESYPTFYFVAFILLQIAIFALIALTIYQWRFKKKHVIHHHG